MSEPPVEPTAFVTLSELAEYMNMPAGAPEATSEKLQETLTAALEYVAWRVGLPLDGLDGAARDFRVYASGNALVLPVTHLREPVTVKDPTGAEVDAALLHDVDLQAGIITLRGSRTGGRFAGRGWTVSAATRDGSASLKVAVKIIAAHLWETQRGREATGVRAAAMAGTADGATTPTGRGYAIPARAAELLEPYTARMAVL